jgi:hypothetical protein
MKISRLTNRRFSYCLLLSAVLMLGIVQWSFLPVLLQSTSLTGGTVVEISPGHSAKFAAPFKGLFGDFYKPGLTQSTVASPQAPASFFGIPKELKRTPNEQFFSYRQLRSPPSV